MRTTTNLLNQVLSSASTLIGGMAGNRKTSGDSGNLSNNQTQTISSDRFLGIQEVSNVVPTIYVPLNGKIVQIPSQTAPASGKPTRRTASNGYGKGLKL